MIDFKKLNKDLRAERLDPQLRAQREAKRKAAYEAEDAEQRRLRDEIVTRVWRVSSGPAAEAALATRSSFDQEFIAHMARLCNKLDLSTDMVGGKLLHLSHAQKVQFERIVTELEKVLAAQQNNLQSSQPDASSDTEDGSAAEDHAGSDPDAQPCSSPLQIMLRRQRMR